jgi:TetR/AcrR family transcriptional regulator, mexJK operon transcriptional repressor
MPAVDRIVREAAPPPRRRAGRPTPERAAEIDCLIRTAARALFLEVGFASASTDDIASRAGVSKGTLYARYASKDALLKVILDDLIDELHRRASATNDLLPEGLGPRLLAYAHKLAETLEWNEYSQLRRLMQVAAQTQPDVYKRWHDAASSTYLRALEAGMRKASGLADPGRVDWSYLAKLFLFAISGWYANANEGGKFSRESYDAFSRSVADTIVGVVEGRR